MHTFVELELLQEVPFPFEFELSLVLLLLERLLLKHLLLSLLFQHQLLVLLNDINEIVSLLKLHFKVLHLNGLNFLIEDRFPRAVLPFDLLNLMLLLFSPFFPFVLLRWVFAQDFLNHFVCLPNGLCFSLSNQGFYVVLKRFKLLFLVQLLLLLRFNILRLFQVQLDYHYNKIIKII